MLSYSRFMFHLVAACLIVVDVIWRKEEPLSLMYHRLPNLVSPILILF